ncbi:MAG: YraN family protein [Clostridia bacterium]
MIDRHISAYAKGIMGEDNACAFLCQRGMVPLFRRYHSPFGELDLVMLEGDVLVFVEVKTRERGTAADGLNAVNTRKQTRMIQTVRCFLGEHTEYCNHMMRFDIVTLTNSGIHHLKNAFEASLF